MPTAVSLTEKLSTFSEHWSPKILGRFNGHGVMVVKLEGEFVRHSHARADDFLLVLKRKPTIRLGAGEVSPGTGGLHVVPNGTAHRPVAEEEAHFPLVEPCRTSNTGGPDTARSSTRSSKRGPHAH
ncbi:MAG: cupin domain-containing protein [Alphaproteobacteria bacterium]|nr:cupin domain-containing protein [Alphaproteobacteria bacterium]